MSKQSALQQFVDKITNNHDKHFKDFYKAEIEEALVMEREQKIEFAEKCLDKALDLDIRTAHSNVEEYYNEIYGVTGMENKTFMSRRNG